MTDDHIRMAHVPNAQISKASPPTVDSRLRLTSLALGASALIVVAPFLTALPAAAATPDRNLLVFSSDYYTDIDQEDVALVDALTTTGATVTTFDGGDGSAEALTAALAGTDVLFLP